MRELRRVGCADAAYEADSCRSSTPLLSVRLPPFVRLPKARTAASARLRFVSADAAELPRVVAPSTTDEVEHRLRIGRAFGVTKRDGVPATTAGAQEE